jgi:thiosulfate/3-mercaptopyruvate sulfurtransferase
MIRPLLYMMNILMDPRLWWLLKYLGHDKTCILNGCREEWIKQGHPVTKEIPKANRKGEYNIKVNKDLYCDIDYVKAKKDKENVILIDSRGYERYSGKNEPLYAKAGHVPAAINYPWQNNLQNNFFKEKEVLKKDFKEIIEEIGGQSKVYIGSFSDWISYEENVVAIV